VALGLDLEIEPERHEVDASVVERTARVVEVRAEPIRRSGVGSLGGGGQRTLPQRGLSWTG
jgi:hypothetical protein